MIISMICHSRITISSQLMLVLAKLMMCKMRAANTFNIKSVIKRLLITVLLVTTLDCNMLYVLLHERYVNTYKEVIRYIARGSRYDGWKLNHKRNHVTEHDMKVIS